jgi:catechol 2,3-dioxygenase-like lactoylglutathione lyase family enzyme
MMGAMRLDQIVVDCLEPARLVRFWAGLLGGEPVEREHGWAHVVPPGWPRISFQPVPEPKAVKNRLHLDIDVDDLGAATKKATALGATTQGDVQTDEQGSFQVLLDPAGNEFCFVRPAPYRA